MHRNLLFADLTLVLITSYIFVYISLNFLTSYMLECFALLRWSWVAFVTLIIPQLLELWLCHILSVNMTHTSELQPTLTFCWFMQYPLSTVNTASSCTYALWAVCRGFKSLLDLVDNTTHDSFDLYYGLFMYNQVSLVLPWTTKCLSVCTVLEGCLYSCAHNVSKGTLLLLSIPWHCWGWLIDQMTGYMLEARCNLLTLGTTLDSIIMYSSCTYTLYAHVCIQAFWVYVHVIKYPCCFA